MFDPVFDLITSVLAWFYSIWPSYGMAIVFLTLAAMLLATPLTMKSTRTMMQMQLLAPELKRIQKEHRGDRVAMNEAQMAFYREHNLNPLGGCLPILVQAPIFLVLYRVVLGLTRRTTEIGTQLGFTASRFSAVRRGSTDDYATTPILRSDLNFDPDFLPKTADLYDDLSSRHEMVSWGVDLARSASSAVGDGILAAVPYFLMMALVLVTGLYQHRQMMSRQTSSAINPTQQTIMKMMPYVLPVVSYSIPGAVVVYFIVSALCRIGQQYYIGRSLYSGEESLGAQLAQQRKSSGGGKLSDGRSGKPGAGRSSARSASGRSGGGSGSKRSHRQRGRDDEARSSAPVRSSRSGAPKHGTRASRSGRAPSRSSRHRAGSGRTSPPGSRARRTAQNRSKRKKKRR